MRAEHFARPSEHGTNMKPFTTLETTADELAKCNRCGFCLQSCPTYRATGLELCSARGRNVLTSAVIAGRLALDDQLVQPVTECLLCGACTVACQTAVDVSEIVVADREALLKSQGEPAILRRIFHDLLPHPDKLTRYVRLLALGKRSRMSALARRLGLLRIISPQLHAAEDLVENMPRKFLTDRLPELLARQPERPRVKVAYFVSCGLNYQLPDAAAASLRVLQAAGCRIEVLPNNCCGQPAYAYGDKEAARRLARQNLEVYRKGDFDYVVTDCGSCSSMLSKYGELLAGDEHWAEEAERFAGRVRDFNALLAELGPPEMVERKRRVVTYHDPCHLSRHQDLTREPRELLQAVPGVTLDPLPEADWCCGGSGSYNIAHFELSMKVLERKMRNVSRTEATELVTACPACMIQLQYGARRFHVPVEVLHVSQIMADALADD